MTTVAQPTLLDVVKAYESWEADLIMDNEAWGPPGELRECPRFNESLWERLMPKLRGCLRYQWLTCTTAAKIALSKQELKFRRYDRAGCGGDVMAHAFTYCIQKAAD